jgi:hypothetical protein
MLLLRRLLCSIKLSGLASSAIRSAAAAAVAAADVPEAADRPDA